MYAEVLVDVPNRRLDQSFYYFVPDNLQVIPGARVVVPLQGRRVQGMVIALTDVLPDSVPVTRLRPVVQVIEGNAMPRELLELALWLAETTVCSVAQSLHAVWPLLKGKVEEWAVPMVGMEDPDIEALQWLDPIAFGAMAALNRARRKALPLPVLQARSGAGKELINQMVQQGWMRKEYRFSGSGRLTERGNIPGQASEHAAPEGDFRPTTAQTAVVNTIIEAYYKMAPATILLHGVTGSGKTAVYREVVARVLAAGGSAIVLVPEIALTAQVQNYFASGFASQLMVLHSGLSAAAKMAAWQEILAGNKHLVIGARSAVFAPLPNLRLIIIDEEHDNAYKQDENPKYHARDVARKRMETAGGIVVLGSATPSLEAYAAAKTGKIGLLTLPERVGQSALPSVQIVDMREELLRGNRSIFSLDLREKLQERVNRAEQAMLFLNRRGYATFVICRECGYTVRCPNCDVALTFHNQGQVMRCHYCNYEEVPPIRCPQCGSRYIRFFGQGTQRVEEEIKTLFPGVPIFRLDWDTTRTAENLQAILADFRRATPGILIGTQMIAKGLDFPNVTLVGVLAADQTLNMPDFRARERTFQLLTQVAGRAGRGVKPGEVVIQTYVPTDRAIEKAVRHDFPAFFWEELAYRRERGYPPFTHVVRVMLMHEQEDRVVKAAHELTACLRVGMTAGNCGNNGLDVPIMLGPAPAVFPRLKNRYRWQLAVRGKRPDVLRKLVHRGVEKFFRGPASGGVTLSIDVDPLST